MFKNLDPLEIPKLLRYEDGKLFWTTRDDPNEQMVGETE